MSYPGNPSLAPDIKGRILETFAHTVDVASKGNLEEARLGCDFVLRLDPDFGPARELMSRLETAGAAVDVADFVSQAGGEAAAAAVTDAAPTGGADLAMELRALLESRDFDGLARRAQQEGAAIGADPALQQLMGEAQEKMEAAHFADATLAQARAAVTGGDGEKANKLLEQVRALDPEHPDFATVSALVSTATTTMEPVFEMEDAPGAPEEIDELPTIDSAPLSPVVGEVPLVADELPAAAPELSSLEEDSLPALDAAFSVPEDELPGLDDELPSLDMEELLPAVEADADELPSLDMEELPSVVEADVDELPDLDAELPSLDSEEMPELGGDLPDLAVSEDAPSGPSDPDERIAALLDEGLAAQESGEYQTAIDAWSRIFLIDIDHEEAARRIELARKAKDEQERQLEESFHEAIALVAAGEVDSAAVALRKVLKLDPNHPQAREALDKLEQGDLAAATGAADPLPDVDAALADDELPGEAMAPPQAPAGKRAAVPIPQPTTVAKTKGSFWMVAAAVLVVVVVGGWFLVSRWDSFFPNTEEPPVVEAVEVRPTPIDRATVLYQEQKVAMAVAQLRRVPPASPFYDEAQRLVGQWEAEIEPQDTGPSEAELTRRADLVTRARTAYDERRFLDARPLLDEAATIVPLEGDEQSMRRSSDRELEVLEGSITLLTDGEYEEALRRLWAIHEEDPSYPDATRLLVTSYLNFGIRYMKQGRPEEANPMFEEALKLDPDDESIDRLLKISKSYKGRNQDLLFRIYIKYLSPREI